MVALRAHQAATCVADPASDRVATAQAATLVAPEGRVETVSLSTRAMKARTRAAIVGARLATAPQIEDETRIA